MKNYQKLATMIAFSFAAFSCMEDEDENLNDPQTQATLSATVEGPQETSDPNNRFVANGFAVSEFFVGTQDVEMRYAAKAEILTGIDIGSISMKTNVNTSLQTTAAQSKSLILIAEGEENVATVGEGDTPEGNYTEVEFKLFNNTDVDETDPMHGKSLLVTGELEGKSTTVWMDTEKTILAAAEASEGVQVDGATELLLVFDMERLFANVDFTSVVVSNGSIDIGPDSMGANAEIFSQIESNLESAVVLKK